MPIKLAKPKVDPVTGAACDHAMADRLHITTIGERSLRFTVWFGRLVDGVFQPIVEGETFAIRNTPSQTVTGLDDKGQPAVSETPADPQFDKLRESAKAKAAGELAWDTISDRAIYPWLIAYSCQKNGAKPYAGEVV